MNAVRSEMAVECEEITSAKAETAVFDFDLDRNKSLDGGGEQYTALPCLPHCPPHPALPPYHASQPAEFSKLCKILIISSIIKENPADVAKYCFAAEGVAGKEGGMPTKPVGLPSLAGGKLPSLSGGVKPVGVESKPLCDLSAPRRKSIQIDEPPADRPKSS